MVRVTIEQRVEAVVRKEKDETFGEIARRLGISKRNVTYIIKKHKEIKTVEDRPRSGRKRMTTKRQDRHLIRTSLLNRQLTSADLRNSLQDQSGVKVTSRTVRRRLREAGLKGCMAARKPLLSKENCRARLQFALEHLDCSDEEWGIVVTRFLPDLGLSSTDFISLCFFII